MEKCKKTNPLPQELRKRLQQLKDYQSNQSLRVQGLRHSELDVICMLQSPPLGNYIGQQEYRAKDMGYSEELLGTCCEPIGDLMGTHWERQESNTLPHSPKRGGKKNHGSCGGACCTHHLIGCKKLFLPTYVLLFAIG